MATRLRLIRYTALGRNKFFNPNQRNKSSDCGGPDNVDSSGSGKSSGSSSSFTTSNPSAPSTYDCRKFGHNLPMDSVMPNFETLPCIPSGIFRCTMGECLGNGAEKGSYYQNPEYFSYQHMTFYDLHLILRCYRMPSPATGRKL